MKDNIQNYFINIKLMELRLYHKYIILYLFRIILTMNPKYGEISRAMRNRGVEIYVEVCTVQILNLNLSHNFLFENCSLFIYYYSLLQVGTN